MRFPFYTLNPFNNQTLIIRYAHLCRFMVEKKTDENLSNLLERVKSKPNDFSLLMLLCKRDLKMARLSLESMAKHTSVVPNLILAHDESLSSSELLTAFQDWPENIEIWDRSSIIKYHKAASLSNETIAIFAERHIFGLKLAACLRAAAMSRVLYSDADVLWFGDISHIMNRYLTLPIYGSHELGKENCDPELLKILPIPIQENLTCKGRCCAGLTIYNKDLSSDGLLHLLTQFICSGDSIHRFAEQTVVNALVAKCGGCIAEGDISMQFPGKERWRKLNRTGIHYPGKCKYQFWIDSLMFCNPF